MKEQEALNELKTIRTLIESSTKYVSLSGVAGVMAGIIAIAGGVFTYIDISSVIDEGTTVWDYFKGIHTDAEKPVQQIMFSGTIVLILSVVSAWLITVRKSRKLKEPRSYSYRNKVAFKMLRQMGMILLGGGIAILSVIQTGAIGLIVPLSLCFYGAALLTGSRYSHKELEQFGYGLIVLGSVGFFIQEYAIVLWILGFGVGHIVYGSLMYLKYDLKKSEIDK